MNNSWAALLVITSYVLLPGIGTERCLLCLWPLANGSSYPKGSTASAHGQSPGCRMGSGSQCGDNRDHRTEPPSSRSRPPCEDDAQVWAEDGARVPAEDRRGLRYKGKHRSEDAVSCYYR